MSRKAGNSALLLSSIGRDKAALVRVDLASGKQTVVGESDKADVSEVWAGATHAQATGLCDRIPDHGNRAARAGGGQDIERLKAALGPQFEVVSRTLDDTKWVVAVDDPVHVVSELVV